MCFRVYFMSPHESEKFKLTRRLSESFCKTLSSILLLLIAIVTDINWCKITSRTHTHSSGILLGSFSHARLLFFRSIHENCEQLTAEIVEYRLEEAKRCVLMWVECVYRRLWLIHEPWRSLSNIKNLFYFRSRLSVSLRFLIGINNAAMTRVCVSVHVGGHDFIEINAMLFLFRERTFAQRCEFPAMTYSIRYHCQK